MIKHIFLFMLVSMGIIRSYAVEKSRMTLTLDGKPRAAIVKPADATPRESLAAEDLQRYILKISGAYCPLSWITKR